MSSAPERTYDPGAQNERTRLAWQRTVLSLTVTGLVAGRLLASRHAPAAVALATLTLLGWLGITLLLRARYRASHRALHAAAHLPDGRANLALTAFVLLVGLGSLAYLGAGLRPRGPAASGAYAGGRPDFRVPRHAASSRRRRPP